MKNIVLDASVIFKIIYTKEEGFEIVRDIMKHFFEGAINILEPLEWRFEIMNILRHHKKSFSFKEAKRRMELLCELGFTEIIPDDNLIAKASNLLFKYPKVYILDCLYHALAIQHSGYLITADKKYYEIVKKEKKIILLSKISEKDLLS